MKDVYILAVETSCDETSIAIVKNGREDVATTVLSQMDVHSNFGGVVPEIASRMHTENITMVLEETLSKAKMTVDQMDAIAVTYAPGLMGSLIVGVEFAKTLAFVHQKPLIKVHHIAGHIYANNLVKPLRFPLLALIVSGGHTDIIIMQGDYKFKLLGSTLDDAIGETYDKVARVLGLPYPGGPNVERMALLGTPTYDLPVPMNDGTYNFSYSGLKSAVVNLVNKEKQKGQTVNNENLAASFQKAAVAQLINKTEQAIKKFQVRNMIIAGGVSANNYLREEITKLTTSKGIDLTIPPIEYCTDNATMIGCAAYPLLLKKEFERYTLNPKSHDDFFETYKAE